MAKIFLIDDDEDLNAKRYAALQDLRHETAGHWTDDLDTIERKIARFNPDVVVVDVFLGPGCKDGGDVIDRVREKRPQQKIILNSSDDCDLIAESLEVPFHLKSNGFDDLRRMIDELLAN